MCYIFDPKEEVSKMETLCVIMCKGEKEADRIPNYSHLQRSEEDETLMMEKLHLCIEDDTTHFST